jgi:hypothetical protein
MRRSTPFSALFSLLRASSVGAIVLAGILSCTDSTSPVAGSDGLIYVKGSDGVVRVKVSTVDIVIPDSVKQAQMAANASAGTSMVPIGPSMTVLHASTSSSNVAAQSCGGGGFAGYTKSEPAFAPDSIPSIAPYPLSDDGYIPDTFVPLGFNFSFEGNTYNKVNVYSNGFLLFGAVPSTTAGFSDAGNIAALANPNNIIALGWTDWSPQFAPDAIRYETRGTAPNRRFVLQFNNVPEYFSASKLGAVVPTAGRFTSQVVLYEGSNDIIIYTSQMTLTNSGHFVTQGIENLTGTAANYDSVTNAAGVRSKRVHNFFNLQKDAVRFSLIQTKDLVAPTMTAPVDITANNDPGLASAVVAVSAPPTSDNCSSTPTVTGVRSDGAPSLNDPYPVGVTTITWTAKDEAGNTSSATQTITVLDKEAPVFGLAAGSLLEFNATSPSGAIVTFDTGVKDNVGVTSFSCEPASGSLFAVGPKDVTCYASDAAGNVAVPLVFTVSVIGAHEQLFNLLQYVTGLNLPNGTSQPLVNQLKEAYSQDAFSACNKLGDFLSMVQKKSGTIPPDEKALMISDGTRVLNATGCSSSISASISSRALPHF